MKTIYIFLIMVLTIAIVKGQDVIVKTDKSEIKSKVIEITETSIKYKKWENIDGPIYNVSNNDVFMIVYANGKRDMIKQPNKQATKPNQQNLNNRNTSLGASIQQNNNQAKTIDTTIDYKSIKVKYKPTRIYAGLQSPFSLGVDKEFRIIKNIVNLGFGYQYLFPKGDYITSENSGLVYASFYAPINRLAGNYKEQDKGLFLFGDLGYGGSSTVLNAAYTSTHQAQTINSFDFTWRLGFDYSFSNIGLTLFTQEFSSYNAGIMVSF